MSSRSLVSVITPLKEFPDYDLLKIAASIQEINETPIEWIIVASPEEHGRVLQNTKIGISYLPVCVESTKNVAAARNAGLDQANGEYVMQFDADDIPLVGGVDRVVDAIKDAGVRWGSAVTIDYAENPEEHYIFPAEWAMFYDGPIPKGSFRDFRLKVQSEKTGRFPIGMYPAHASASVVSTELARNVGGWDEDMPILEDMGFIGRVAAVADGVWVREPSFIYRKAGPSESTKPITDEQWVMLDKHISSFEESPLGDIQ